MGHVDFYPNGGKDQPGCSILDAPSVGMSNIYNLDRAADQVSRHLVSCSHTRAISLYIESLRGDGDCVFVGHECPSHEAFRAGICFGCSGGRCAQMGYNSYAYRARAGELNRKNVKFYLNTGAGPEHFCRKFLEHHQSCLGCSTAPPTISSLRVPIPFGHSSGEPTFRRALGARILNGQHTRHQRGGHGTEPDARVSKGHSHCARTDTLAR